MISEQEAANFDVFRDCLSTSIIQRLAPDGGGKGSTKKKVKGRKNEIKPVVRSIEGEVENDAAELGDFVEYLAEEIFLSLPSDLRTLSYSAIQDDADLGTTYSVPMDTMLLERFVEALPLTVADSLTSYNLIVSPSDLDRFLEPAFSTYITSTTSVPPEHTPSLAASRPEGCEICEREHLPLTYHHLIPRAVHTKAVKRGWHREWELNKVAWLCRACHSFVHKIESNEVLAKDYYSVELLIEREDVQKWAGWVGRIRWKAR
ncbi:related to 2-haloalkanoic acid dehalogenase [Ramularia collo-cygni]|uniref:Related to 2-haloalkanoic acid dehalogenase n=1 Tax=Ramularia collo-cygni TaxID=112498 RepID=A0A2D3VCC4_9PEZI|nr:related to 2-haloalkanoic acid dehalogenase [Ramularia collo-cygni]CZT23355.1 related to 2-haloalkanoic acid dehalogenase [Ramularia collo-cygni]